MKRRGSCVTLPVHAVLASAFRDTSNCSTWRDPFDVTALLYDEPPIHQDMHNSPGRLHRLLERSAVTHRGWIEHCDVGVRTDSDPTFLPHQRYETFETLGR